MLSKFKGGFEKSEKFRWALKVVYNNNEVVSYADNIEFNLLNGNVIINMFDKEDRIKIKRK